MDLATFPEPPTAARGAPSAGGAKPLTAPAALPAGLPAGGTSSAEEEGGRRGRQGIYKRFLESSGGATDGAAGGGDGYTGGAAGAFNREPTEPAGNCLDKRFVS